jgi:hypothetical protein
LATTDKTARPGDTEADVERLKERLDSLDDRLDNIDSMVSAVAERVLNQLLSINVTCPHCGKDIEIAVIGTLKPKA